MTAAKKTEKIFPGRGKAGGPKPAVSAGLAGTLAAVLALAFLPVPAVRPGSTALTASAASVSGAVQTSAGTADKSQASDGGAGSGQASAGTEKVTLRIANWEEYMDEGDWDEEEAIDLD